MRSGKLIASNDIIIEKLLNHQYYDVRSDGTIWTRFARTGKLHLNNKWRRCDVSNRSKYVFVSFTDLDTGKRHQLAAHRIIYAKHLGKLEIDLVINHKDGNPSNNLPSNLELVTQSRNNKHVYTDLKYAPVMGNKVLTWEIVRAIRLEHQSGSSYRVLSNKYGISKGHISSLINCKTWIEGKEYR